LYTLEEISRNLIQSDNEEELPVNFVAAAVKINNQTGIAYHAGIVIGLRGKYFIFHYTSITVVLGNIPNNGWYFHKGLDFISEEEVESFLVYCKIIKDEANPTYGYFYGGSCYNEDGRFFSSNELPEIMTCVGFCLNVILGFIESDEYLKHDEWDIYTVEYPDEYFVSFIEQFEELLLDTDIDIEILKENLRRITPDEYLASAFIEGIPIAKKQIDKIIPNLRLALKEKIK
jgi:hypothetical protein